MIFFLRRLNPVTLKFTASQSCHASVPPCKSSTSVNQTIKALSLSSDSVYHPSHQSPKMAPLSLTIKKKSQMHANATAEKYIKTKFGVSSTEMTLKNDNTADIQKVLSANSRNWVEDAENAGGVVHYLDVLMDEMQSLLDELTDIETKCPLMAVAVQAAISSLEIQYAHVEQIHKTWVDREAMCDDQTAFRQNIAEFVEGRLDEIDSEDVLDILNDYSKTIEGATDMLLENADYDAAWAFYKNAITSYAISQWEIVDEMSTE